MSSRVSEEHSQDFIIQDFHGADSTAICDNRRLGGADWPIQCLPADRIANAVGATHLYPNQHVIVIDFGTATTFNVVHANRDYLGGLILSGLRIAMEALEKNTARLPTVEIVRPTVLVGRSTIECIQSGLYFGHLAIVKELSREIRAQAFGGEPAVVIGTGGFSRLFEQEQVFDVVLPDLILMGLERALSLNEGASHTWKGATAEVT
jgi:type III pantothenate kinase